MRSAVIIPLIIIAGGNLKSESKGCTCSETTYIIIGVVIAVIGVVAGISGIIIIFKRRR